MHNVAIALLAIVGLVRAVESPVTKVITLIEELKKSIEEDGKTEQKIYNKYACWCETMSARKADDIHLAMKESKSLGTSILRLRSLLTSLENDIAKIKADIRDNQKAQELATAIRQKENDKYLENKGHMEATLSALEGAIDTLSGAGTGAGTKIVHPGNDLYDVNHPGNGFPGLLQVSEDMNNLFDRLPDTILTKKQLTMIKFFKSEAKAATTRLKSTANTVTTAAQPRGEPRGGNFRVSKQANAVKKAAAAPSVSGSATGKAAGIRRAHGSAKIAKAAGKLAGGGGGMTRPMRIAPEPAYVPDGRTYYDEKAGKDQAYNPASSTIMGILKDMYDTFALNLEESTETEATQMKNFETLMGLKANEMSDLTAHLEKKEKAKAEAQKELADTSQNYDTTVKQMKEDEGLFDDAKAACMTKSDEWSERVRARTEELAGINKALGILTSDDAKALLKKAIKPGMETLFLQTSGDKVDDPRLKAYFLLKSRGAKSGNLKLMALASKVKTQGMFDMVIKAMDEMVEEIKEEQQEDFVHRDWCKQEIHKNDLEVDELKYQVARITTKVHKKQAKIKELEAVLQKTIEEIMSVREDLNEIEETRMSENAAFKQAKTDDEGAIKVLTAAIDSFGVFYDGLKPSFVQHGRQPVFEVSPEQAPDAKFSAAGKSSGSAKGIISIMTMLKEDLEDEIKNGVKMEEESQIYYDRQTRKIYEVLAELKTKQHQYKQSIADANKLLEVDLDTKEDLDGELKDKLGYLEPLKAECKPIIEEFDARTAQRDADKSAIIGAKGLLAAVSMKMPGNKNKDEKKSALTQAQMELALSSPSSQLPAQADDSEADDPEGDAWWNSP